VVRVSRDPAVRADPISAAADPNLSMTRSQDLILPRSRSLSLRNHRALMTRGETSPIAATHPSLLLAQNRNLDLARSPSQPTDPNRNPLLDQSRSPSLPNRTLAAQDPTPDPAAARVDRARVRVVRGRPARGSAGQKDRKGESAADEASDRFGIDAS